jgi:hypothetical protein
MRLPQNIYILRHIRPRNFTNISLRQSILPPRPQLIPHPHRYFSSTTMTFQKPSSDPPKHEMAYFPDMTTSLPSESGDFRRVLWTGLYSQLVLMTVPVGGDIGDEVG